MWVQGTPIAESVCIMFKRIALLAAVSSLVWACAGADAADDSASSEGAATAGPSIASVFGGVEVNAPKCFEKVYPAAHLASHPKQTVSAIRVELAHAAENDAFNPANGAKVTFQQKSGGPHIRELSCDMVNGKVLCTEEPTCKSSVDLALAGGGLRMTNHDLRVAGACDEGTPTPLSAAAGADDVFDLVPVACDAGQLANPPTVDCSAAIAPLRACIEVLANEKCENMITKGTRYADEFTSSAAEGKRLESAEECIQRFTDPAEADGCCGG